ncbi:uncharacterized protein PRCAT00003386001 [Priceomyces carsonii]|uniref:uncharacterized protein n=1 Tax=Priceomyces carsonii TaxID=28549 RepID=UPI002ED97C22|nr:unnamed protein product [Priceomyces carsonii]
MSFGAYFGRSYRKGVVIWMPHSVTSVARRSIFITSNSRRNKKKELERDKIDRFINRDAERKLREQETMYRNKLKELKLLTQSVSERIKRKEEDAMKLTAVDHIEVERDSEILYKNLQPCDEPRGIANPQASLLNKEFRPDAYSLVVPAVSVPDSISRKIGIALKYLVSKNDQRWDLVLQQLSESGGFTEIPRKDVKYFIENIPRRYILSLIPQLENMMSDAGIKSSPSIINSFIEGISAGSVLSDQSIKKIEEFSQQIRSISKTKKLPRRTYELLIMAYGKNNNLEKINSCLAEMKKDGLQPSSQTFVNILSTCVYKANDHKQAVEIFDSMKFLSVKTNPDTSSYQHIIVSYVNNDNIEKALDLYQEMISKGIPLNQEILIALARGCSSRPRLSLKSWDFVFDIYENGWEPTLETFEYIIYLAARSGDLPMTRALYFKLNESKSISSKAFSFLLLAYSKSRVKLKEVNEPPNLVYHDKGRIFRKNILSDVNYLVKINPHEQGPPFLPKLDLNTKEEILAESSAVWTHAMIQHPNFINIKSANTYLNIAAEMGTLKDFRDRFESTTFLDRSSLPEDKSIIVEEPSESVFSEKEKIGTLDAQGSVDIKNMPIFSQHSMNGRKVARSSLTYVIAIKAAGNFKNYNFAQKIWSERGTFRKTSSFKVLSRLEKDVLDFQFASAMVSCLTKMNLLDDAEAILLSTEYQFKWKWKELKELHKAAVEVGNEKLCKTVRNVARRAQINFEGKIRRKDFKRYLMERGY